MDTDQIRDTLIRYFEAQGHLHLSSASLIPHGDPSVLLTTAGMQPFKAYYVNPALAPARRIVTIQRCARAQGADDDTSNIGDDTHHTFFEMLGNFAFGPTDEGGYYKKEAIAFAYELVTQGYGIKPELIWIRRRAREVSPGTAERAVHTGPVPRVRALRRDLEFGLQPILYGEGQDSPTAALHGR